jgi:23S rRNA (cytosine1962-C5)-methyltransferase
MTISNHPFRITVRKSGLGAMQAHHPWMLAGSLEESQVPADVTTVDLVHPDGRWLGRGLYNPHSRIRVRVYEWSSPEVSLDESFFVQRLERALALRRSLSARHPTEAQRLVFSEADQLSGLIVDRYAEYLVIQQTAAAIGPAMKAMVEHLVSVFQPRGIILKIDAKTAKAEGMEPGQWILHGEAPEGEVEILDDGLAWRVDLVDGQKTGFYLDQRENRRAAASYVPQDGRVLDVCCYVGGFAISIGKWSSAREIIAIDSSHKAIEAAARHATLNHIEGLRFEVSDFYDGLGRMIEEAQRFDMVVLDPPRMAGSNAQLASALRAYHRLNYLATRVLNPGGILVTCSCSGRVSRQDFEDMLLGVSKRSHREIQILERRGAASDHPSILTCPETDYLKCFICRVI